MKRILFLIFLIFSIGIKITFAQAGCWAKKKNMTVARCVMPAVVLNDSIYVIGGSLDAYMSTSAVEAYDAATDNWTFKANLPRNLCGETAGTVNNRIYVIGGSSSVLLSDGEGYVVDNVYEYNPNSNSWMRKSNIPTPLAYAAAAVMDGKIYIIGGCPFGFNSAYKSVYEYNPATDTWTRKSDMPTARFLASATVVDGKIYVFGGIANLAGTAFSTVEVYDPSADTWTLKRPMPVPGAALASSALDGNIYILCGGTRMGTANNNFIEYNPTLDTCTNITPIPTPRVGPAASSLGGKIYVFGGMDISNNRLTTVEVYDPTSDTLNITAVRDNKFEIISSFILGQNYPNPFNPTTKIKYSISLVETGHAPSLQLVQLNVYDLLGRETAILVNEVKPAGTYEVIWNAAELPSGVYLYQLKSGNFTATKKLLLLK